MAHSPHPTPERAAAPALCTFSSWSLRRKWMRRTTASFCFSELSGSSRIRRLHSSMACRSCSMSEARNSPCREEAALVHPGEPSPYRLSGKWTDSSL